MIPRSAIGWGIVLFVLLWAHGAEASDLPLPSLERASLKASAELVNTGTSLQEGSLILRIMSPDPGIPALTLEQPVDLGSREARTIDFEPSDFPELLLQHPRLWWPNGLGTPVLYRLEMRFEIKGETSDHEALSFGIREVSSSLTEVDGWTRRDFFINGHKVRLRGGAWVPDMMLNRSREKLQHELSLCRRGAL